MSVMLVGRFLEDKSMTSIAYKQYNDEPEGKYPTFSICFKGTTFYWRNELAIFNEYGIYSYQFEKMLKGKSAFKYEYDPSLGLYKTLTREVKNSSAAKFDSFHLQIEDILEEVIFTAGGSQGSVSYRHEDVKI